MIPICGVLLFLLRSESETESAECGIGKGFSNGHG